MERMRGSQIKAKPPTGTTATKKKLDLGAIPEPKRKQQPTLAEEVKNVSGDNPWAEDPLS